jgi:pilus assembly protein CpaE
VADRQPEGEIRLLLVEDMPQVAQYIRSLLDAQSRIKLLDVLTDGDTVVEQIIETQPDVLVVDALLQGKMNGLQVATKIREQGLDLPIVALTVPQKPVSVGEGMGDTRVLSMPFSGYDFMRMLQELHAEHRAKAPESMARVYSIFSAKGGVGTTTLAYNICASIASRLRIRVALLDGSLQFGDLRSMLQVPEDTPSIVQLPIARVQKADLQEVMYHDKSGVDVLFAPPRIELAEMITPRDLQTVVSLMRKVYNVVMIDTTTNVDDNLLAFLDVSDELIQVLTYEWTSLHRARAMADTLGAINYPSNRVRYLVNRADSTGGLSPDALVQALGRKADFEVVSDGILVLEANNRGMPFIALGPQAQITMDIARIADELVRPITDAMPAASRR